MGSSENPEEKRALIRRLHDAGVLVAPALLNTLTPASAQELLQKAGAQLVLEPDESPIVTTATAPSRLRPGDVSAFYRARLDALRPLLVEKTESVSVAHLAPYNPATVIGVVAQLTPTGFILDDPTGTLQVTTKDTAAPGEVVAVSGNYRDGALTASRLLYPGIPISRPLHPLRTPILLSPVPAETPDTLICPPSFPARIALSSFTILAHRPSAPLSPEQARHHLLARCFPAALPAGADLLLLDPPPGLVWLLQDQNWQKSCKGTLIVSTRPDSAARIGADLSVSFVPGPAGKT